MPTSALSAIVICMMSDGNNIKKVDFRDMDLEIKSHYLLQLILTNSEIMVRDLDLSDKLIYEIADGLGFSDCYYFSRVFKKVMGLSPRAYRKRREDHYFRRWKT